MNFPTQALDPDGKIRAILVDSDGKLVTDAAAKPDTTHPITLVGLRVDASGNLRTT